MVAELFLGYTQAQVLEKTIATENPSKKAVEMDWFHVCG